MHFKVKKFCDLRPKERTIYLDIKMPINNKYIIELLTKFEYNIQYEMFTTNNIEVIEPEIVTY